MWHKLFRNDLWVLWIMYGLGIAGTCFSPWIIAQLASGLVAPVDKGPMIGLSALGPALLGAALITHLDYLLELRSKRRTSTHPARTNAPTMSEVAHS